MTPQPSRPHPDDVTLARALDSADTRASLDPHLADCATCRARLDHLARVSSALGAIATPAPDPRLAHDVLARLTPPRRSRGLVLGFGLGVATAALAILVVGASSSDPNPGTFTARGSPSDPNGALTLTAYLQPMDGPRVPLGARFTRGDALSFRVIRRDADPRAFLMVLGCDAANDVIWAAPTWDDPASDPVGLAIDPGVPLYDLPTALIPEGPPGPFTVVALTTPTPIGVRHIESLVHTCADLDTLATLPGATLARLSLHLDPPAPSRHP